MNNFIIHKTEFGINEKESKVSFKEQNGLIYATIDVYGNEKKHESLSEDKGSEWAWTLYPPHFYFREVHIDKKSDFEIELDDELLDDFDIALYMMEHADVFGTLSFKNGMIKIEGEVHLGRKIHKLFISLNVGLE